MFERKSKKSPTSASDSTSQRQVMGGPRQPKDDKTNPQAPVQSRTPAPAQPQPPAPAQASAPVRKVPVADTTTLGQNVSVVGDVRFTGTLIVNGKIKGSVGSEDSLVVGSSGRVHGEVCVGVAEISGKVEGGINASTSIRLLQGAEVDGDIESPSIAMEEGVSFQGCCTRPEKKVESSKSSDTEKQASASASVEPSDEPQQVVEPSEEPSPVDSSS